MEKWMKSPFLQQKVAVETLSFRRKHARFFLRNNSVELSVSVLLIPFGLSA